MAKIILGSGSHEPVYEIGFAPGEPLGLDVAISDWTQQTEAIGRLRAAAENVIALAYSDGRGINIDQAFIRADGSAYEAEFGHYASSVLRLIADGNDNDLLGFAEWHVARYNQHKQALNDASEEIDAAVSDRVTRLVQSGYLPVDAVGLYEKSFQVVAHPTPIDSFDVGIIGRAYGATAANGRNIYLANNFEDTQELTGVGEQQVGVSLHERTHSALLLSGRGFWHSIDTPIKDSGNRRIYNQMADEGLVSTVEAVASAMYKRAIRDFDGNPEDFYAPIRRIEAAFLVHGPKPTTMHDFVLAGFSEHGAQVRQRVGQSLFAGAAYFFPEKGQYAYSVLEREFAVRTRVEQASWLKGVEETISSKLGVPYLDHTDIMPLAATISA